MEYAMMVSPFGQVEFKTLKKKEAQEYFEWYVNQIDRRIHILSDFLLHEEADIDFDYSPESLIPLWAWYEKKIKIIDKTSEELAFDYSKYPEWLHNDIPKTKISPETLKYGMDLNPRLIIINCTRHSSREFNSMRLYETYYIWLKYIK